MSNPEKYLHCKIDRVVLDHEHGLYIPQIFCQNNERFGCRRDDWERCLKGPYWEEVEMITNLSPIVRLINSWKHYLSSGTWISNCPKNTFLKMVVNQGYWESWDSILDNWGFKDMLTDRKFFIDEVEGNLVMMEDLSQIPL